MKLLIKLLLLFGIFGINISFAAINLTVSPIKYEIDANTWSIITKTATLHNRWNTDITIITWKSDFVAWWTDWSPTFLRYSELVHPDQQLSSWINLSSTWFIIPSNSKKEITFTINVPSNATPGWHYWAVFFKNNNSENSSSNWNTVWINVDYGIIILLKVEWEIVTEVVVNNNNIVIENNSSNKWGYSNISDNDYNLSNNWINNIALKKDNCLLDFTDNRYDWKCFDNPKDIVKIIKWDEDIVNEKFEEENKDKDENDFNISFKIPVDNKWNTHIKTTWEIKLFDEEWNQIKQIWKKIKVNDKWAIIWEEIVDYIPVNDNKGNVLPWTKRIFNPEWLGFPFKKYDQEQGKEIISYKNPWDYYSDKELNKEFRLFPWERICYDKQTKKITAKFNISYLNEEWKEVSFPSAQEFDVSYTRKYIWYNYYLIFSVLILLIFLFILFWIIWLLRKKKCINKDCKKRIKRKLKICPYCDTLQEKKKVIKKIKKSDSKKDLEKKSTKKTEKKKVVKKTTKKTPVKKKKNKVEKKENKKK